MLASLVNQVLSAKPLNSSRAVRESKCPLCKSNRRQYIPRTKRLAKYCNQCDKELNQRSNKNE